MASRLLLNNALKLPVDSLTRPMWAVIVGFIYDPKESNRNRKHDTDILAPIAERRRRTLMILLPYDSQDNKLSKYSGDTRLSYYTPCLLLTAAVSLSGNHLVYYLFQSSDLSVTVG